MFPAQHTAACLLIKDESEYLREWIAWHAELGITRFYVYDNSSNVPVKRTLDTFPGNLRKKICLIDWSGNHTHIQRDCYNHCIRHFGQQCRWIAFLDSDEFLRLTQVGDIGNFLQEYEDCGALYVSWLLYGAGGQVHKKDRPVRERFREPAMRHEYGGMGKLIVCPSAVESMQTHHAILKDGKCILDENRTIVQDGFRCREFSGKRIVIDHYYTKSYEEWCAKILRGSCDPVNRKCYEEFFAINPDLAHLRENDFPSRQNYG